MSFHPGKVSATASLYTIESRVRGASGSGHLGQHGGGYAPIPAAVNKGLLYLEMRQNVSQAFVFEAQVAPLK